MKNKILKKSWVLGLVIILTVVMLTGCVIEETPETNSVKPVDSEATNNSDKEETPEEPETPEFFSIGEAVEASKIRATITDIEKHDGSDFNRPADGKEFVLLHLTIENISDKETSISSMLSFNAYVDDVSMNESISAQIAKEGTNTVDGTIAAGKKLNGILGYEVPQDWKEIEIHFTPEVFSNTTIKWLIENNN